MCVTTATYSRSSKELEVMSRDHRRNAFTLIEVLIVVIIMAVLAATIIPQFSSSTTDDKTSAVTFNLHTIRSQIEMFKVHHNGALPVLNTFSDQMTKPTDVTGSTTGTTATLIYGPYFQGAVPMNPFTNTNTLVAVATAGKVPTGAVTGGAGWQYDVTTGGFYPNNAEYYVNNPNP
jgi:general secretion pathway protein G